jgi:hypothetical protein
MKPPPGARKGITKKNAKVKKTKTNKTERTIKIREKKNWKMRNIVTR